MRGKKNYSFFSNCITEEGNFLQSTLIEMAIESLRSEMNHNDVRLLMRTLWSCFRSTGLRPIQYTFSEIGLREGKLF